MAKLTEKQRALHKEYSYQLSRIKKVIKGATQRGFIFPKNVIPPRPDKITRKHVEELKEKTAPSLYKEAQYVEPSTGEVVSGYQGRKTERKRASKKAQRTKQKRKQRRYEQYSPPEPSDYDARYEESRTDFYSDAVIKNFRAILSTFNAKGAGVLSHWIDALIMKFGKGEVADMLERGAQAGVIVTYDVVYEEQLTIQYMADMVQYLWSMEPEDADSFSQDFYDALEEDGGFSSVE